MLRVRGSMENYEALLGFVLGWRIEHKTCYPTECKGPIKGALPNGPSTPI